ncbi:PLP-dependent aspartate aminotransferase family protein [Leptospira sp. WS92.C1]
MNQNKFGIRTRAIHSGQGPDPHTGAVMTPIYATSTFAQESPGVTKGYEYSRSGNPTRTALESCLTSMEEGASGYAFASGLAAETCLLELLPKDSHIIALDDLYGGTFRLLDKVKRISSGLEITFLDLKNPKAISSAIQKNTKMIWVETPSNPLLKIIDLEMIAETAKKHGLISVCDNTFATPILQRPLTLGFDVVVHSATKYLNGHSDIIAGALITREKNELSDRIGFLQNATGAILSPFDSFLLLRGLKTLPLRMGAHTANATEIAHFLEADSRIERVIYPGLSSHPDYQLAQKQMEMAGGMITFFIKGGIEESKLFLQRLKLFSLAESLGGVESLAEHPAIMTHASIPAEMRKKIGIEDNLIRLSVGIEDVQDLKDDISAALDFKNK